MDPIETSLLLKLQKEFPLCAYPYEAIATDLGIPVDDCLSRVRQLKESGVIRQISAIFDSRRLGYQSALVAAKIPAEKLEAGAAQVSSHPGVSHNYERAHDFNLWFTLALAPDIDFAAEAARLAHSAHAERFMILPSLRTFKIEVALDSGAVSTLERAEAPCERQLDPVWLSEKDRQMVRLLQEDMPIEPRPFQKSAAAMGMSEDGLFEWMAEAGSMGILRRFAAILRHRKAGFSANGMGVWRVPAERIDEVGRIFASFRAVSHCYERPSGPDWPYNLFSMVHAKSNAECDLIFHELSRSSGIEEFRVLISAREFKKERVRYFLEKQPLKM